MITAQLSSIAANALLTPQKMMLIASLISALVSQAAEETTDRPAYCAANRPAYGVTDRATDSVAMVASTALAGKAL